MRFQFDAGKNRDVQRKHNVSLEEAREIFDQVYLVDRKNDNPEQFRAIGWSRGRLCSVIFEIRRDRDGEYYRLVTAWKATKQEEQAYANQAARQHQQESHRPHQEGSQGCQEAQGHGSKTKRTK